MSRLPGYKCMEANYLSIFEDGTAGQLNTVAEMMAVRDQYPFPRLFDVTGDNLKEYVGSGVWKSLDCFEE